MKNEKKKPKSILFLALVLILYVVFYFYNPELSKNAFSDTILMFVKLIPTLIFVFIIMFIINLYVKPEKIKKHLGKESGWRGWFYASIAGILISGPPYILFPLLADLKKSGMRQALLAVLLYDRNVKIPYMPLMVAYFGLAYTVIVSLYIILFSFLNGILIEYIVQEK